MSKLEVQSKRQEWWQKHPDLTEEDFYLLPKALRLLEVEEHPDPYKEFERAERAMFQGKQILHQLAVA